jgi:hypothetical protein
MDDRHFGYKQKSLGQNTALHCIALGTVGLSENARGSRRRRRREWRSGRWGPGGRTVTQEADGSAGVDSGGREAMLTKLHTQSGFPFPFVSDFRQWRNDKAPDSHALECLPGPSVLLLYGRSCRAIFKVWCKQRTAATHAFLESQKLLVFCYFQHICWK